MSEQVEKYYADLRDPADDDGAGAGAFAFFHEHISELGSRASEPLHRAQRRNQHVARQCELDAGAADDVRSELFGDDIKKIIPVINTDGSDSAQFDNCVEMLVMAGRELPHAMMMMIPEPWENHESMDAERRAFYEYHSCLMEPWDGPASMAFTDGKMIGACLDRNGLRPSRYYVTKDDLVIMASEAGVLPIAAGTHRSKGRLQPGRMFLVDIEQGRIVADEELKKKYASAHPYQKWLDENHDPARKTCPSRRKRTEPDHRNSFATAAGVRLHV